MTGTTKAHLGLWATAIFGAMNFSASKILMPEPFDPFALILVRSLCAAIFFWAVTSVAHMRGAESRKDLGKMFLCAVFGVVINQMLFYKGLSLTSPINAALAVTIVPIFVLILSVLAGRENFTVLKVTGVLIGAAGVAALLLNSSMSSEGSSVTGDIMVIINALSYAIFLILTKDLMKKYHAFTVLKWLFTFGFFIQIPFGYQGLMQVSWGQLSETVWYSFIFVIIFATLLNYALNTAVLKWVDASVAGVYFYLNPLLASVFAIALGLDTFSVEKTIFFILILSGVWMVSSGKYSPGRLLKAARVRVKNEN